MEKEKMKGYLNRQEVSPIPTVRSSRMDEARGLTSLPAGKMVPLKAIPLLREDSMQGRYRVSFEMHETAEVLLNAVNVRVMAYLVPWLAFDRFEGSMDAFNKSYAGQPSLDGGTVIPFIEKQAFGTHGSNEVYKYLGVHGKPTDEVNTMYLEAYNQIWNQRATNRSEDIVPRGRLDGDLAEAFWLHQGFKHIVPDFDQAVAEGEVALNVIEGDLPVKGIGLVPSEAGFSTAAGDPHVVTTMGNDATGKWSTSNASLRHAMLKENPDNPGFPGVFAEMQENGITVSLANIELAKKTQAFAKMREQYSGHSEQWLIDMLMNGLQVPDQALKQPMLLADKTTVIGMQKRYATDGASLTDSVVNGATYVDLAVNIPRLATGGVVMIVAEITPEQMFERQKDMFLHADTVEDFPEYMRDFLDPEKVAVVTNDYVDIDHDTPNATFGYAPLNYQWNRAAPNIGGRYYRPEVDAAFDEDRQRIWAVETQNPTLSKDFYLCTTMHTKPFADTVNDPFEAVTRGLAVIHGNTVFGYALREANNNYDAILDHVDQTRIDKEA
jgi:hypothetical protein